MRTATILLTVAVLAGCRDRPEPGPFGFGPDELAAFMGTAEERAARAPYSPPGWPLQPGDTISRERWTALLEQFPDWRGIHAPFWVGARAFGAAWQTVFPAGATTLAEGLVRYEGHRPQKTGVWDDSRAMFPYVMPGDEFPAHLRGADPEALKRELYCPECATGGSMEEVHGQAWTQERWLAGWTGGEGAAR